MKILITGGMGVIGSMLALRFVQEGCRPLLVARHIDKSLIQSIERDADIESADVLDLPRIFSIIKDYQVTHIVHMAALTGALSAKNPPLSVQVNVMGTLNILEAARLLKIKRVVYASAKGVYGHIEGEYANPKCRPVGEDHPKNPIRIYDSAKLMGEHMGEFYRRTYGLEFVALRFSSTYGPGKTVRHGDKAVVSRLIEGSLWGQRVIIEEGGDEKNDFIYTKDAAQGLYLACIAPGLNYAVYNIGTGVGVTLREFAHEVERLVPGSCIEVRYGYKKRWPDGNFIYDITRAKKDLGFSPRFSLRGSIEDYIETFQRIKRLGG